jgi:hypothetical protein
MVYGAARGARGAGRGGLMAAGRGGSSAAIGGRRGGFPAAPRRGRTAPPRCWWTRRARAPGSRPRARWRAGRPCGRRRGGEARGSMMRPKVPPAAPCGCGTASGPAALRRAPTRLVLRAARTRARPRPRRPRASGPGRRRGRAARGLRSAAALGVEVARGLEEPARAEVEVQQATPAGESNQVDLGQHGGDLGGPRVVERQPAGGITVLAHAHGSAGAAHRIDARAPALLVLVEVAVVVLDVEVGDRVVAHGSP